MLSQVGSQITLVALFVQVYTLTHSSAAVGAVGLVQLVPMVVVSLGFGPQIDRSRPPPHPARSRSSGLMSRLDVAAARRAHCTIRRSR